MNTGSTEIFWMVDKALLYFSFALAGMIFIYVVVKARAHEQHQKMLVDLHALIQTLDTVSPKTVHDACLPFIEKASFRRFFEFTKSIESIFPGNPEYFLKDCVADSRKIKEALKAAARSRNKWRRIEAIIIVGYANPPLALAMLKKNLTDKDEDIVYFSMVSVSKIHTREAIAILFTCLSSRRFSGYRIVSLLEQFPSDMADEFLNVVSHEDPIVRFWALKLLGKFKPAHCAQTVEKLVADSSPDVRAAACECLGIVGSESSVSVILDALDDSVWFVRMHAVRALYAISGPGCVPQVVSLINDNSWPVREEIKKIMSKNIEASLSYIETCLTVSDEMAKKYCIDALVDSGYVFTLLKDTVCDDPSRNIRAQRLLGLLVHSGIYFGLKKSLDDFPFAERIRLINIIRGFDTRLADCMDTIYTTS
ncbi:MAG: HEAT repeat domain-containing protein [Candidatus Omnitrophica bacterium]|nr:HEAT repeat domain-containing protein [Candidatus Omnitrophota bacterium]